MRIIEIVLLVISVIGFFFLSMSWPFGGELFIIGIGNLSLFYMALGFVVFQDLGFRKMFKKDAWKGISTKRIVGGIGTGFALSILLSGLLFILMFWPFGKEMAIQGLTLTAIIFAVSLILLSKNNDTFYKNVLKRLVPFMILTLCLYLMSTDQLVDFRYGAEPELAELVKQSIANPDNEEIQEALRAYYVNRNGE